MNVIVQLDSSSMNDPNLPLFQMAHECIHLLTPVLSANASVLEEGLATYFSKEYMAVHMGGVWLTGDQKYDRAEVLARKLLLLNADAIKALRELVPVISRATAQDILKICPNFPSHLSEQLVVSFQSWDGNIGSVGAKPTKLHL
jgi:secreted Zn-dependent insulinase-like peptidase